MKREHWKSRIGFIWAAAGSAVGLGNIWRFPYVVGENGGATFVLLYLICLFIIGFPILIAEILIGRTVQSSPFGAFLNLGKNRLWGLAGKGTVITGFLVSTFYGVIAAWTFGYLVEAIFGQITHFSSAEGALKHFSQSSASPIWSLSYLLAFMLICLVILYTGVRKGIEGANKIFMPLLLLMLVGLAIKGITMPNAFKGIAFLFSPDWSELTPRAFFVALGQASFALSIGQGTMVTYGSYVSKKENLPTTCFPIALFGTFVSLLAGIAIFSIVFSMGLEPAAGPSLMFETLPLVLSQMAGGYYFAILFFLLIFLAGLTSQISALEPLISHLMDNRKWGRHKAVFLTIGCSFLVGVPCALSFGPLKHMTFFGMTIFTVIANLSVNILVPLGGLAAAILVGWRWGMKNAIEELKVGSPVMDRSAILRFYLRMGIKYIAPIVIVLIMLDQMGIFKKL